MRPHIETLGEICQRFGGVIQTGPFGSQLHEADYVPDGVPVVMPKDIINGRINTGTVARITDAKAAALPRHKLHAGAIVMPRRGDIGKCALVRAEESGWLCGTGCLQVVIPESGISSQYLYYYLHLNSVVEWLEKHAVGTTMLNLNTAIVSALPIVRLGGQRETGIAKTLAAYDDLIENNRRRIALLEEAARQLYREWFIRLRFPGHEHTRVIRGIPDGWRSGLLSDFYDTASGGTPSRKVPRYFDGDIPWVKTQELQDGFVIRTGESITEEGLNNSATKLFPERTVLVALYGATVGRCGILGIPAATNQACCALLPNANEAHYAHAFLFLREKKDLLINLSAGAAQKNISQQIVRNIEMVMPSAAVMNAFVAQVHPLLEQCLNMEQQNERLRIVRDALLPRLMDGRVQ